MFPSACQERACQNVGVVIWGLNAPVQGLEDTFKRYIKSPVVHVTFPAQYMPLLFHGGVPMALPAPTKSFRFPRLRGFNLSQSKRRCQDHEQSAQWYVACCTLSTSLFEKGALLLIPTSTSPRSQVVIRGGVSSPYCTLDKPRVVIRHLEPSNASLLHPVGRRSQRLHPPIQEVIAANVVLCFVIRHTVRNRLSSDAA